MTKRKPILDIYKSSDGWRWRLVAVNSRIICESGEAFVNRPNPGRIINKIMDALHNCRSVVEQ